MVLFLLVSILGVTPIQATETTIEQMPAKLETQFALSALPPAMRTRQPFTFLIQEGLSTFPTGKQVA